MMESLSRGLGEILYEDGGNILLYDKMAEIAMMTCEDTEHMDHMISLFPKEMTYCMVNQKPVAERMMDTMDQENENKKNAKTKRRAKL